MYLMHSTDVKQIIGWLKHTWIDVHSRITSSILWQRVNESWRSLDWLRSGVLFPSGWWLVTPALGYPYEWVTTIESVDRKDWPTQWPLFSSIQTIILRPSCTISSTLISGPPIALSTFISHWSWKSLTSQQRDHKNRNIFVLIGRNYPVIVRMWPRDIKP